jgi:Calcineurin-like phosphoesterase
MQNPIKVFEPNLEGRDFVIGDLHGAYDVFLNLLENLKFDGEKDRMFSVGDLVDRGPDSLNCLRLLKEKWFHCVLANHEQMMLEAFDGGYMGQYWFRNGGGWGFRFFKDWEDHKRDKHLEVGGFKLPPETQEFLELLELVRELPFIMTVGMQDGSKTHIIHAELPPAHRVTDSDLSSPGKLMEIATVQSHDGDFMVWGRHKFYPFYKTDLSNLAKNVRIVKNMYPGYVKNDKLSRIVSGHTIVQRSLTILGQTNIDTQAYGSYPDGYGSTKQWCGLTCIELNEWKFTRATPTEYHHVSPIVVNTSDLNKFKEEENGGQPA